MRHLTAKQVLPGLLLCIPVALISAVVFQLLLQIVNRVMITAVPDFMLPYFVMVMKYFQRGLIGYIFIYSGSIISPMGVRFRVGSEILPWILAVSVYKFDFDLKSGAIAYAFGAIVALFALKDSESIYGARSMSSPK